MNWLLIALGIILLVILWLCFLVYDKKCPHWKYCQWYEKSSYTCNETGGCYHYDEAGCCRDWNEKINKRIHGKKWKKEKY